MSADNVYSDQRPRGEIRGRASTRSTSIAWWSPHSRIITFGADGSTNRTALCGAESPFSPGYLMIRVPFDGQTRSTTTPSSCE